MENVPQNKGEQLEGKFSKNIKKVLRAGTIAMAGAFTQAPATAQVAQTENVDARYAVTSSQESVRYENNSNTSPKDIHPEINYEVPPLSPQVAKMEQERKEALGMMLHILEEKVRELGKVTELDAFGKKYPVRIGSIPDNLVARAQQLREAAEKMYETAKGIDYRNEQAALMIIGVIEGYEKFATAYAAFLENNQSQAEALSRILPVTGLVLHEERKNSSQ